MKNFRALIIVVICSNFLVACGAGSSSGSGSSSSSSDATVNPSPALIGYFTNWSIYGAKYQPSNIPANVDEVNYAFFQVGDCDPARLGSEVAPTCVSGGGQPSMYTGTQDYKLHSIDPYSDFPPTYTNSAGYINYGGQSTLARALYTGKKIALSVGGFSTGTFIRNAIEPVNRPIFVSSIVQFMRDQEISAQNNTEPSIKNSNKFYGVDIDWEPNGNYWTMPPQAVGNYQIQKTDLENFRLFLKDLKLQMKSAGYNKLSITVTANPSVLQSVESTYGGGYWQAIATLGIEIRLMTYDYYAQSWSGSCAFTGFNSPLNLVAADPCNRDMSLSKSVNQLAVYGVPKAQIGVGVPAYGYAWSLTAANKALVTQGNPFVAFDSASATSVYNTLQSQSWTYRTIITNYLYGVSQSVNSASLPQLTTWSAIATSADALQTYATSLVQGIAPAWISFTSPTNAYNLGKWARKEGLSGVMVWSLDGDVQPGDSGITNWYESSLIYNLYKGLAE
ncbi:glycoside hydrolase family 18 protein [Polynucleobacter sp. Ross1-W9]|uniref:glycoside hydrolase family 18 protein n=1 Tax=Polynucleobacter parvulilacunae TaxID=1855631 RepID=UPI001C0D8AE4|nr:glycoside hydrolase family 18 protein [Polynucleobacter parvulilacunae]MBU3557648.1 glycoside hydrolase family 18 protein [Polynucleobacter parvulilacunae]